MDLYFDALVGRGLICVLQFVVDAEHAQTKQLISASLSRQVIIPHPHDGKSISHAVQGALVKYIALS